ncbi:MAG: Asp23/Gls24 family envelope stress response protein [Lachnospiraceae bacterium]|nr:Asp23/Gls24 family envelope stress response protein [Lachnospiraceae bacterium]
MNKELQTSSGYTMEASNMVGEVKIADDVVATIAGLAATEVEGVYAMSGNLTNEIVGKLGMKNLSKGVKIELLEKSVSVELSITMKYGYSIPKTSKQVQDKVKTAIETMTGLTVSDVNIRIVGVDIEHINN